GAAAQAVGRHEIDDGIALLQRAVELEGDPARQAELWYEVERASALKYDGELFASAMEKAVELGASATEVYSELAFQTVFRAGMWTRQLDREVIAGWIERALDLSAPGSVLRAK